MEHYIVDLQKGLLSNRINLKPGSISNSSVHANDTAATHKYKARKDLFNGTGPGSLHRSSESSSGHGSCNCLTISESDHKSFHHLGKSTSTFRNQSLSTETTQSYQAPISRAQEPISRPQEPISRSQDVSRPQATDSTTRSYTLARPNHSRTYSYPLNKLPPPAVIPVLLPRPIPHLPPPAQLPSQPRQFASHS